jgi:ribosomal protein S20
MRSAQECAEAARRLIRAAAREPDAALKKRLLKLAQANRALVRLANLLAKKSQPKT